MVILQFGRAVPKLLGLPRRTQTTFDKFDSFFRITNLAKRSKYVTSILTSIDSCHNFFVVGAMAKTSKAKKQIEESVAKRKLIPQQVPSTKSSPNVTQSANSKSQEKAGKGHSHKPSSKLKPLNSKEAKPKRQHKKYKQKRHSDLTAGITQSLSKLEIGANKKYQRRLPVNVQKTRAYSTHSAGPTHSSTTQQNSLDEIVNYIKSGRAKNIVVMCGAGISTASGIPDFRTPGTGLYDNLKRYNIPYPTAVFDLDYFQNNPRPFFELAKELYPSGKYRPNGAHYFVRALHEKGLLMRLYTQNIDGLERIAGIPSNKLVEAHGTFATASCVKCGKKYDGEDIKAKIFNGKIPRCQLTPLCYGVIKPDIVFFGEDLPKRFYYYLRDFPVCDMLIVMGTSLEVEPFASLVDSTRYNVPRLLLNRDRVGPFVRKSRGRPRDHALTGELTETVKGIVEKLDWKDFFQDLIVENEKATAKGALSSDDGRTDSGVSSASSISSKDSEASGSRSRSLPPPADGNIKRYFHTIRSTPLPKPNSKTRECGSGEPVQPPTNISYYDFIKSTAKPKPLPVKPIHTDKPNRSSDGNNNPLMALYSVSKTTKSPNAPKIQYTQTVKAKKTAGPKKFAVPRSRSTVSMPNLDHQSSETDSSQSESDDSDTSSDS